MPKFISINDLEDNKDRLGLLWSFERCKSESCKGKRITLPFEVTDDVWNKVTNGNVNILCHACFDEIAQEMSLNYKATFLGGMKFIRTGDEWEYEKES